MGFSETFGVEKGSGTRVVDGFSEALPELSPLMDHLGIQTTA